MGGDIKANEVYLELEFAGKPARHLARMNFRAISACEEALDMPLLSMLSSEPGKLREPKVRDWARIAYEMLRSGDDPGYTLDEVGDAIVNAGINHVWPVLLPAVGAVYAGSQREDEGPGKGSAPDDTPAKTEATGATQSAPPTA